jgi:mannose-6-phosphate isomerase-like protein (cupin superfamily)
MELVEAGGLTVAYNFMEPDGGAEMHTHEDQNHVFYVLAGEMKVFDGTREQVVPQGSALVVKAGEAHQVTGTGKRPCEYLLVTSADRRGEAW